MKPSQKDAADLQENEKNFISHHPPHPQETPPMIVNDISHLFHGKMRSTETEGIMSQHGARMILSALARQDGLRQTDLVRLTHMKAPTVSVTIKKMAAEGLIRHEVMFSDLRAIRLHLTEKGKAYHEGVRETLQGLDDVMMRGFSAEETEQLSALLNRMRQNLVNDLEEKGLLRPAVLFSDTSEVTPPQKMPQEKESQR